LDIDPPKAERFMCNLVLGIWDLMPYKTME